MTDWIQTYTGRKVRPLAPDPEQIVVIDIAHSLAMQCRFNGFTRRFYSVAEHCCHVHDQLPLEYRLAGLLHDASEAYLLDVPRPLKRSPLFAEPYRAAEVHLQGVINQKYGVPWPWPEKMGNAIHVMDANLLATEATQLMRFGPGDPAWQEEGQAIARLTLPCWTPTQARTEFIKRFYAAIQ